MSRVVKCEQRRRQPAVFYLDGFLTGKKSLGFERNIRYFKSEV